MTNQGLHNLADAWSVVCVVFGFFAFICWAGRNRDRPPRPTAARPAAVTGIAPPSPVVVVPRSEFEQLKGRLARLERGASTPSIPSISSMPQRRETEDAIKLLRQLWHMKHEEAVKIVLAMETKLGPVPADQLVTAALKQLRS